MTVAIVSLAARGAEEIAVTFSVRNGEYEQRETFSIHAAWVAEWQLCVGESSTECYDRVCHVAELWAAMKRGLYLLGYGSCSERALRRRLVAKGVRAEMAEEAVAELARRGYLNAEADAKREAEKCVAKCWGKRRIAATLYQKGYTQEAVNAALYALEDDEVDYVELCAQSIRRKCGELPTDAEDRRRLTASLERLGFSFSEIREAFSLVECGE